MAEVLKYHDLDGLIRRAKQVTPLSLTHNIYSEVLKYHDLDGLIRRAKQVTPLSLTHNIYTLRYSSITPWTDSSGALNRLLTD